MPANPLETALKLTGMYFPTVLSIANYRKDESAAYWNFSDGISSFLAKLDESTLTWQKLGEAESLDQRIGRDKSIQEYGYTLTPEKFVQVYGEGYERQGVTEESKPALVTTLGIGGTQALMTFLQNAGSMPRENAIAVLTTVFGVSRTDALAMIPEPQEEEPGVESQLAGIFGGGDGNGNGNGNGNGAAPPEAAPVEASEAVDFRISSTQAVKRRSCDRGYPCGDGCISRMKRCRKELEAKAKFQQEWLKQEAEQLKTQLAALQSRLQQTESALEQAKASVPKPGSVVDVSVSELNFDPDRFQYKLVHGATGSSGSLSGVKTWDANLAGVVQAWVDPVDGKTYVINGHNRANLAKQMGVEAITVRYLDVKDAQEARAVGALTNIAEGRGNALDAAKFFKDSGLSREDLQQKGIPMREKVATDGLALAELDDVLFSRVINGDLPQERAVIIGGSRLNKDEQRALVELVEQQEKRGRKITNEVISELTDVVKSSASQTEQQFDLFGMTETTKSLALEKATLQAAMRKKLSREKKLFSTVAKSKAAQDLAKAGNVIDVAQSKGVSEQAAQTLAVFDQLKNLSGPVSGLINQAADRIANGESASKVQDELYKKLVESLPDILKGKNPEFVELMDQVWGAIAFAAVGSTIGKAKTKNCQKGYPCGFGCIQRTHKCRKALEGQAASYQDWLERHIQITPALNVSQSRLEDAVALGLLPAPKATKARDGTPIAVLQLEDRLRQQRFESFAVFDEEGNQLSFKNGQKDEVAFSWDEVQQMKGKICTHNHPLGWDYPADNPQYQGSSFSQEDWQLACYGEMAELRAVSPGYRHSIKPPEEGWNGKYYEDVLKPAMIEIEAEIRQEFQQQINQASKQGSAAQAAAVEQACAKHYHELATRLSERLGITYTREEYTPWTL